MYLRYVRRVLLQGLLEIGKSLHELACVLARCWHLFGPCPQVADESCEKTFGSAYRLERQVRDRVPEMAQGTVYLLTRESDEIHVCDDEFDLLDLRIETRTSVGEETSTGTRLVLSKGEKAGKERE